MTTTMGCCAPRRLCDRGADFRRQAKLAMRNWKTSAHTRSGIDKARAAYENALSDLAQHLDLNRSEVEAFVA